jgi:hypothetical protein
MLKETRIVEEALLATPSANRPKSIAHHRYCDTTASAERHRKEPNQRPGRVAPGRNSLAGFHVSISLCSCVWRPWLLPLHHKCDAAVDFIFRKNLAEFFKFP